MSILVEWCRQHHGTFRRFNTDVRDLPDDSKNCHVEVRHAPRENRRIQVKHVCWAVAGKAGNHAMFASLKTYTIQVDGNKLGCVIIDMMNILYIHTFILGVGHQYI